MLYRFGSFELDTARVELREGGETRRVEPQVFALLALLVEHRERMISKDEIIEKVWDGRIVSEAAVSSRIKSARQALGDDGQTQRYIKTVHRQGFRFVAEARAVREIQALDSVAVQPDVISSRPSIAVLPFRLVGDAGRFAAIADALPDELITELSRLHWLFVTARGSSFRVHASAADMGEIGRLLGVRYCLKGHVEVAGPRLEVNVELVDTRDGGVVWADRYSGALDDVHAVRSGIRSGVLTALEFRIPLHEAALARLKVTEQLDAWSAYHLGLQHLYRFNRKDSAAAAALFTQAIARDPGFARAHAGLSFVHFQTAFLRHTDDIPGEVMLARGTRTDRDDRRRRAQPRRRCNLGDRVGFERPGAQSRAHAHGFFPFVPNEVRGDTDARRGRTRSARVLNPGRSSWASTTLTGAGSAPQPCSAARRSSAMSSFTIVIIACMTRPDLAVSGPEVSSASTVGTTCHDRPYLSLSQPHCCGMPPSRSRSQK